MDTAFTLDFLSTPACKNFRGPTEFVNELKVIRSWKFFLMIRQKRNKKGSGRIGCILDFCRKSIKIQVETDIGPYSSKSIIVRYFYNNILIPCFNFLGGLLSWFLQNCLTCIWIQRILKIGSVNNRSCLSWCSTTWLRSYNFHLLLLYLE